MNRLPKLPIGEVLRLYPYDIISDVALLLSTLAECMAGSEGIAPFVAEDPGLLDDEPLYR